MMGLTRSENMRRIRSTGTGPERLLAEALEQLGPRLDAQGRTPVGRPDLVDAEGRIAVFIDGCFWHGCPDHYVRPGTREELWAARLAANVDRDQRQTEALRAMGWRVLRLWECEVREDATACAARVTAVADLDNRRICVERVDVLDPALRLERRHLRTLTSPVERWTEDGPRRTAKRGRREPTPHG